MSQTHLIAEQGQHDITMTRIFDAPRELVFKTMTDAKHIAKWWGPRQYTTTVDQLEAKPGGLWRFVQTGMDGSEFAFHGVYHSITAPQQTVYTFEFEGMPGHVMLETVTLEALADGKTKLIVTGAFQTVADRNGMIESGMEQGANESYDRLAELLATL